jgi:VanZ family protein
MKYWIPVVLWIAIVYLMSTGSMSGDNTASWIEPILRFIAPSFSPREIGILHGLIRKAAHVAESCISGMLLFCAFRRGSADEKVWVWAGYAILGVIFIAVVDEFHQSFIPVRTSSIKDVGLDLAGGMIAQAIAVCNHYRRSGVAEQLHGN